LLSNVPNPFNPQTRIRFELSQPGSAQVGIFDVSGRLVRTLVSESLAAGPHERVWQGKDNDGRQVPSGAYYVRLVTRAGVDHCKIMLLK
jgi:flagellar hook assembly protein FlgD